MNQYKRLGMLFAAALLISCQLAARRVGVYCHFAASETCVYQDSNMCARLLITQDGAALVEVTNLTDEPLCIDRMKSFAYVNGSSSTFYQPVSNTESYSIGRAVVDGDNRAGDVRWVHGEMRTVSSTVSDQAYQLIAPRGVEVVYGWDELKNLLSPAMVWLSKTLSLFSSHCRGRFTDSDHSFSKGDSRAYTSDHTPLTLAANILYSVGDDSRQHQRALLSDYISSINVDSYRGVTSGGELVNPDVSQHCFAFRSGRARGAVIGEWTAVTAAAVGIIAFGVHMHEEADMPDMGFSSF